MDYLALEKKQELTSSWLKNTFVRYRIHNNRNSLSEAIMRSFHRGEYKYTYKELENFYGQVRDHLEQISDKSQKELYLKVFQDEKLKKYIKKNGIILVKDEKDDLRKLGFYFEEFPSFKFYFFPKEIRGLEPNCNLLKYLANIDIDLPYNYFRVRFEEKLKYIQIYNNVNTLKEEKDIQLCDETVELTREKKALNSYLNFSKNLFSSQKKEDYKFYLFLYPKIFNINFIILIPFENEIVVENIIEENSDNPYLILFKPFEMTNFFFKIEIGALMINRKAHYILKPQADEQIIEAIKSRYYSRDNNIPIIEYLKNRREDGNKYLKDYDFDNTNKDNQFYQLLDKIKYYNYNLE